VPRRGPRSRLARRPIRIIFLGNGERPRQWRTSNLQGIPTQAAIRFIPQGATTASLVEVTTLGNDGCACAALTGRIIAVSLTGAFEELKGCRGGPLRMVVHLRRKLWGQCKNKTPVAVGADSSYDEFLRRLSAQAVLSGLRSGGFSDRQ